MKVAVLGRGLAALGVIEALSKIKAVPEVHWIGPSFQDKGWPNCSRNSTAVVALQGIKKGISPLGDDLVDAFCATQNFIHEHTPKGVQKVTRYHFGDAKLKERFGYLEQFKMLEGSFTGVVEEAFLFEPLTFISWWHQRLFDQNNIKETSDFITEITPQKLVGLAGEYSYDLLFDCRGSMASSEKNPMVKEAPGHYFLWRADDLDGLLDLFKESVVLTVDGHNLNIDKENGAVILGGSTEKTGLYAPAISQLEEQLKAFIDVLPQLRPLSKINEAKLLTGIRPKGAKRRPLVKKVQENHIFLNGFYKNGYSLCHLLGNKAVSFSELN